ncbi:deoxynucleotide monophosphate kinase family protein [Kitasatospora aureofaciens]|uniref:deoxynucleotide monophosphate kinase family protein n=1 Tax=Kitasatospora aureofaciens TaxID=1894 RepID=UPI0036F47679
MINEKKFAQFGQWLTGKAVTAGFEVDIPYSGARTRLADATGIDNGTLCQVLSGARLPGPSHQPVLAAAVKVALGEFEQQVEDARRAAPRTTAKARKATSPLIGLAGLAQCGKDSAAGFLAERGWMRRAFADPLRQMLYSLDPLVPSPYGTGSIRLRMAIDTLGWDVAKVQIPEVRTLLQRLGTDAGRVTLGESVWVDQMFRQRDWWGPTVITDVRFPNEADAVKRHGGLVVQIVRPSQELIQDSNHVSEQALAGYSFDAVIVNGGSLAGLGDAIRAVAARM